MLCNSVAQVAPEFEPVIEGSTITVYVDEDIQPGKTSSSLISLCIFSPLYIEH